MRTESRGQAFKRAIEQRGGIEWIAAAVEQGRSMRWIANDLGCGRWWLDRWMHAAPDRRESVLRARARVARDDVD